MTRLGVPGVWTHGFYDGWAPNYAFYAANGHNAIGRFYETQGAGNASTRIITTSGDREWYRPNPPLRRTLWSIRNNVNMQGSAVQIAQHFIAENRVRFMENFYLKSKRSVEKPYNEGPAAYVFPGDDPRPGQVARLMKLMKMQGVEVHEATRSFTVEEREFPEGSLIIRMDQPYSRMADMMLDRQYFNVNDPRPYDDVGWTMGPLYNIQTVRIEDTEVLSIQMNKLDEVIVEGGVERLNRGQQEAFLINHNADNPLATFRFKNNTLRMHAAEESFEYEGMSFNAGTFIIRSSDNSGNLERVLDAAGREFGFTAFSVNSMPEVPMHELSVPRVALMHTWQSTQAEGWVRISLDEIEIPYDYISVHDVRDNPHLRDRYDVILFGPSSADALSIVNGLSGDSPISWAKSDITPNIGIQASTDDMRGGLEFEGVLHLRDFIRDGGLLITITNSSSLPVHFGFAGGVSIRDTGDLWARGGVWKAEFNDMSSPIAYGYSEELGVYFNSSPVFGVSGGGGQRFGQASGGADRPSGRGSKDDPDRVQGRPRNLGQSTIEEFERMRGEEEEEERGRGAGTASTRPRTILSFTSNEDELLISGGVQNGSILAGAPAVVDSKFGEGHVVMFSINPMWRHQTHGSFFLVFNAMLNYNNLDAGSNSR
ncbi:hypothetical protein ACFL6I_10865, partial [candidate division KSB1 bacterium]